MRLFNPKFNASLLAWFDQNQRIMPWRSEPSAYRTWISEIMLQQTQVETVIPYFNRFIQHFPNLKSLAEAEEPALLKLWEGLGYYSRARNLQRAAKLLVSRGQTTLPSSYEALLQLPGIGPYTAAAIASIAFQQVKACLDGNVLRVLSRVMASDLPIDVPANRNTFQDWADQMVDPDRPGDFNQAMMELGATLCKPKSPKCTHCPIQPYCRTVQNHEDPQTRPQKAGRVSVKTIAFQTVLIQQNGRFWLGQRPTKGLLANLWEFPGWPIEQNFIFDTPITSSEFVAHRFTHLDATYHIAFLDQPLATPWPEGLTHYQEFKWVTPRELSLFPLTKATHKILKLLAQPVLPIGTERL